MSFGNRPIDPGTNLVLPVAVDTIATVEYQRVKLVDPSADQTGAWGIDSNPIRTRPRIRGTQAFDTGLVELPTVSTEFTAVTFYMQTLFLHNRTTSVRKVTISNSAQNAFRLDEAELLPKAVIALQFHAAAQVGLRWHADFTGVFAQIDGEQ